MRPEANAIPHLKYYIRASKARDVEHIIKLVNDESERSGAVLKITSQTVKNWIKHGFSLVAKTKDGEMIGHLSAYMWPQSGWIELRSSVVKPEFRGNGISSRLTRTMESAIRKKHSEATLVAFTNKKGSGKGILLATGFREAEYEELPKELFTIGPKYRGKKEYGYKIFVMPKRQA